jgi:hypothetical protein
MSNGSRKKNQIEVSVPVNFADQNHTWYGGFGDVALGLKRTIFSSLRSGSIFSLQGEVGFPTGNDGCSPTFSLRARQTVRGHVGPDPPLSGPFFH